MSATVGTPRISSPFRLVPKTAPVYPDANRLCRDTNPNFPGWLDAPATTTPRGSKSALNCSSDGRRRRRGVAGTAADGRSSTRASTATGRPSAPMISGLTSTLATSSRSLITRPTATRAATSSSRLTAGSPRKGPSNALDAQFVDHPGRHRGVDGCWAEHDVGDRFGEHAADAEHHGRSELRITNGPRNQLAPPLDHRSDQQLDVTVVGLHRAEQRVGGLADRIGVDDAETKQAALGLVGDPVAAQLEGDGKAQLGSCGDRPIGVARPPAPGPEAGRTPPSNSLEARSDSVVIRQSAR